MCTWVGEDCGLIEADSSTTGAEMDIETVGVAGFGVSVLVKDGNGWIPEPKLC